MESKNLSSPTTEDVSLEELAGVSREEERGLYCDEDGNPVKLTYDQLVQDFCDQHKEAVTEYKKMSEALDNMSYSSTVTRVSLEGLQEKKDKLNKLQGAVEALYLFKMHVDPTITDKDFTFED
ncbi:hypothetical protein PTIM40_49 [Cyanophage P-TIM40]|uniref:Uncharacterized protein n=1 Tax=Cyanophage P-TIM40 TaxID=1589733 RepID=A0A0C5AAT1_9CAUD|nr:hypothetical protein AU107_gp049 [Cyanophage P-TIM40]AJK27476.1 hypothetical protein PTIM40_49 [Cyanophage P-TIM40]|tara:strand:+ start:2531 stop:2899 length:369 start_codon:yes stop_codon:yes gene_type:complete